MLKINKITVDNWSLFNSPAGVAVSISGQVSGVDKSIKNGTLGNFVTSFVLDTTQPDELTFTSNILELLKDRPTDLNKFCQQIKVDSWRGVEKEVASATSEFSTRFGETK